MPQTFAMSILFFGSLLWAEIGKAILNTYRQ